MFRPTLRQTIGILLSGTSLIIALVISLQSYLSSRRTMLLLSQSMIQQNAELVREQVNDLFTMVDSVARLTLSVGRDGRDGRDGRLDLQRDAGTETYFYHLLSAHPNLTKIDYGDEAGRFVMVARQPGGVLRAKRILLRPDGSRQSVWSGFGPDGALDPPVPEQDDVFDPRVRPWYVGARQDGDLHWTDAYVFHSDHQIGVTASLPHLAPDGRLLGVLSVDVSLLDLSRYLRNIRIGKSGHAFLVDEGGHLVAGSDLLGGAAGEKLTRAVDSPRPEVASLALQQVFVELIGGSLRGTPRTLRFGCADNDCVATLVPMQVSPQRRWLIGVVALEDEFLADARRTQMHNLAAAVVLGMLGLILGTAVARLIAGSLERLVLETARVQHMHLDASPQGHTRFREVYEVLQAFEGMKTGLRAFQKYVPTNLVRALLSQQREPRLGGEVRELTLFFSDIRGFTSISEALQPMALAEKLGRYLSAVTNRIHAHQGTVDKYIGDAVMAFWGAPLPVHEHAFLGCLAALECQAVVRALSQDDPDQPLFYTRIGVHTAEVVVGNFGSAERFNYTVIGDGVNVASRLEGLNTLFGTEILISENTRALVGDRFEVRRLSQVAVKGRERPFWVYELLGQRGSTDEALLLEARRYEAAFALYLERRFAEAAAMLELLEDAAARRLLRACRQYEQAPPPAGWTGVVEGPRSGPAE